MRLPNVDVIEIEWCGPYSAEWVIQNATKGDDCGIYQIYGTHPVFGPDALLYIGASWGEGGFSARISSHCRSWPFNYEATDLTVYLGRLGSAIPMNKHEWPQWDSEIHRAERLLIAQTTPPYNIEQIHDPNVTEPTIVLNFKRRHRLPATVTSLLYTRDIEPPWQRYGSEPVGMGSGLGN